MFAGKRKIKLITALIILLVGIILLNYSNKSNSLITPSTLQVSPSLSKNPTSANTIPEFDHIFVIIMENKSNDDITNTNSAPYINSLSHQYSLATNYFAVAHPSLPNYVALLGGSTFGLNSDCMDCFISSSNLVDLLEQSHHSWKAYMESMPTTCFLGDSYPYAQKHNPFIYFNDIRTNSNLCKQIVPFSELQNDLNSLASTANLIWISPNLCNDMHDCSIKQGDTWLSQQVPVILQSPAFTLENSLLIITWDEGEGLDSNHVATILIGSHVKPGFVSHTFYNHYSLLHTIETAWHLPSLTENDQKSQVMADFFQ